jgi:hypothetical protein
MPGPPRQKLLNVEAVPALNVHQLYHAGALVLGTVTRWQWPNLIAITRAEIGRILLAVDGGLEVPVLIDWVPAYLGGDRPYFECPGCGARRWDLYLQADIVACRICLCLDYASRHEWWSPALRQAIKLRRRLGAEPGLLAPLPPRPRHYKRRQGYDRLVARIQAKEARAVAELQQTVSELARRHRT